MPTFIDGIAASENIDSSGERIIIAGLDCSSLEKDGVFNYEHKNDQPNQVVGKILKARKIFSEKDAEDDRQLHYFKKCGVPYLYVMGELFDDYKDSAREIAGMFRYDADKKGQNERNVMNFSIEGAKIDKQGMDISKSIGRKVTITVLPCNKVAEANMVPAAGKKPKESLGDIFKTETGIEIELFKPAGIAELMVKSDTLSPNGTKLGTTASGKDVFSHARVGDYKGFSSHDHRQASELHTSFGRKSNDAKAMAHHSGKAALHLQAAGTAEKREARSAVAGPNKTPVNPSTQNKFINIPGKRNPIAKAETAGSGNVAPSQLTGTAALAKEDLVRPMKKTVEKGVHIAVNASEPGNSFAGNVTRAKKFPAGVKAGHKAVLNTLRQMPKPNLTKSSTLMRAEEAYSKWEKREQFEQFMAKRMPNLTKGEIKAIGQTLALQKSFTAEQTLAKMAGMQKSEGTPNVGHTQSGKMVHSDFVHDSHAGFSHEEHLDAAELHGNAVQSWERMAQTKLQQHKDMQGTRPVRTGHTARAKSYRAHADNHRKQEKLHAAAAHALKPITTTTHANGKRTIQYKDGSQKHVPTIAESKQK